MKASSKRRMTRILSLVISALLISCAAAMGVWAVVEDVTARLRPDVTILLNGQEQIFYNAQGQETHPILYNGTTYLPLRATGELMGKNVNWDQNTLTVTIEGARADGKTAGTPDASAQSANIQAQIRSDFTVIVDGVVQRFQDVNGNRVYPLLYNGSTYLPVRSIGNLLGCSVDWVSDTQTVILTAGNTNTLVTDADSFNSNPQSTSAPQGTDGVVISAEEAKTIALAHAGLSSEQAVFVKSNLEYDNGRRIYDVEFYTSDRTEYDYEIDAYSGAVLNFDYDTKSGASSQQGSGTSYIGEEKAQSIALSQVSGADGSCVKRVKLERDDGRWEYSVKIIYNAVEYEIEIDAYSGAVLSVDAESVYD